MKGQKARVSSNAIPAVLTSGWSETITLLLEACPNKFKKFSTTRGIGPTKADAEKAMKDNALTDDLNCGQYKCDDGTCEIDAVLFGDPTFAKSKAKSLKGRDVPDTWVCEQLFVAGCFCTKTF